MRTVAIQGREIMVGRPTRIGEIKLTSEFRSSYLIYYISIVTENAIHDFSKN